MGGVEAFDVPLKTLSLFILRSGLGEAALPGHPESGAFGYNFI